MEDEVFMLNGYSDSVWVVEKVWEMNSGDSCTMLYIILNVINMTELYP